MCHRTVRVVVRAVEILQSTNVPAPLVLRRPKAAPLPPPAKLGNAAGGAARLSKTEPSERQSASSSSSSSESICLALFTFGLTDGWWRPPAEIWRNSAARPESHMRPSSVFICLCRFSVIVYHDTYCPADTRSAYIMIHAPLVIQGHRVS